MHAVFSCLRPACLRKSYQKKLKMPKYFEKKRPRPYKTLDFFTIRIHGKIKINPENAACLRKHLNVRRVAHYISFYTKFFNISNVNNTIRINIEILFAKFGKIIIPEALKANKSTISSLFELTKDTYALLGVYVQKILKREL